MTPIVSVKQSPMNKWKWLLVLECGHEHWVTARAKPKRKVHKCWKCEQEAA